MALVYFSVRLLDDTFQLTFLFDHSIRKFQWRCLSSSNRIQWHCAFPCQPLFISIGSARPHEIFIRTRNTVPESVLPYFGGTPYNIPGGRLSLCSVWGIAILALELHRLLHLFVSFARRECWKTGKPRYPLLAGGYPICDGYYNPGQWYYKWLLVRI